MSKIKIMDEILANKIAAGEVVEKCASVVKELVENSIDAGSKNIKVELIDAGTRKIKVTDDGYGMEKEDAILAFNRHATSKVIEEEDLYNIITLGFRGEALASIASVSRVELQTSTGDVGTIVIIEGGELIEVKPGDARRGTIITIKDLFYNTPARLKYMRSLYTELANVTSFMNRIALSYPNIKFSLYNNGNLILNTDGSNNLLKTISAIYGIDVVKNMIEIKGNNNDYDIYGYITKPEIHRSNRSHMITLVNGRVVRNFDLNKAINDSYHTYKPENKYPIVVINVTVDPSLIDVNIHPTKQDIKFSKMEELIELIERLIKEALTQKNLIPRVNIDNKLVNDEYVQTNLMLNREQELEKELIINNDFIISDNEFEFGDLKAQELEPKLEKNILPELYPIGVVHGTYIVAQNEMGMYLIDQHAAKERINYEYYKEKLGNPKIESIDILIPITVELPPDEFIILKEYFDLLKNMNFSIEEFGINSIIVKSHPTWLPSGYEESAIRKIIDTIIFQEKNFEIEKFNEKVAINLSCKLAIKANENISLIEMENLINDLRKCDNPYNCPHGRPTIIYYSKYDLEKLFKRSGF